jgi:DNA repair protein RecN (Recombination protein N)
VLHELRVENLLLMERAELRLAPGLNILTGETGAGKTLLAHALDLLLGGKARGGIVRQGAAEAYVEGVFSLPPGLGGDERVPDGADELVLARRVWPDGRTRAYVCGRTATVVDLRELGARLLAFYGQHEHRKLMLTAAQLDALDGFCGQEQLARRELIARSHERVRELEQRLEVVSGLAGARERELDLLAFELREIEEVAPSEDEERELTAERERLRHAGALQEAAVIGAEALAPEDGEGAIALVARAAAALEAVAAHDPALRGLGERLEALRYEAEDVAGELRSNLDGADAAPGRLEEVEERLGAFARLARKHGGTIAEVLAHAERCRSRQAELNDADSSADQIRAELAGAATERELIAGALRAARLDAAPRLARAVRERLAELAMADARFEVVVRDREDGYGARGADTVEFMIAANAGLPLGPLREVASGGELSRVMLALLSVAHGNGVPGDARGGAAAADRPLLVFDEIDAGIGGLTARAVGAHLRDLAAGRQLLCITHLPQVAAMAARHFTIVKDGSHTPAVTTVAALAGDAVVGELVRMLGANEGDRAARGHARELLKAA